MSRALLFYVGAAHAVIGTAHLGLEVGLLCAWSSALAEICSSVLVAIMYAAKKKNRQMIRSFREFLGFSACCDGFSVLGTPPSATAS